MLHNFFLANTDCCFIIVVCVLFLFFFSFFLASVENAFASDEGPFDYVVNFAAETKYGQSEPVSMTGTYSPTVFTNC